MNKKILTEGRYDSFTRQITRDIIESIKSSEGEDGMIETVLPDDDYTYHHESGISFNLFLYVNWVDEIKIKDKNYDFFINSFIDEENELIVEMSLTHDSVPGSYEKIFYKLTEDIRHELEHYTQEIFSDRPKLTTHTAKLDTVFKHHTDPTEIEALVQGFYRRAKQERKPLDVVMLEDLKDDISKGNLTPSEADQLLKVWVGFAKRRLPKAIYSKQY